MTPIPHEPLGRLILPLSGKLMLELLMEPIMYLLFFFFLSKESKERFKEKKGTNKTFSGTPTAQTDGRLPRDT